MKLLCYSIQYSSTAATFVSHSIPAPSPCGLDLTGLDMLRYQVLDWASSVKYSCIADSHLRDSVITSGKPHPIVNEKVLFGFLLCNARRPSRRARVISYSVLYCTVNTSEIYISGGATVFGGYSTLTRRACAVPQFVTNPNQ